MEVEECKLSTSRKLMAEIELYIVRHGLAGEHGSYADDTQRPLTEEGQQKTRQVAQRLKVLDIRFDCILTSPLVRAQQTAEILQKVGLGKQLETSAALAPGGNLDDWLTWLETWKQTGGKRMAIVGHEPGLSHWAETLVWGKAGDRLVLKKAGVIGLILPTQGSPVGSSTLFWLSPPRFLL